MSSQDEYFLSFLENVNPIVAQTAKKMEELMFEDPSSSIMKARLFTEEIINEVFKIDKEIDAPYLSSLNEKIRFLSKEGYIEKDIQKSFDVIRLSGNKAVHDGKFNDITEAYKLHKEMYNIAVWFFEVYTSEQKKLPIYEIPKPKEKIMNIEEIVKNQLLDMLNSGLLERERAEYPQGNGGGNEVYEKKEEQDQKQQRPLLDDLPPGQSYLLRELRRLQDSSKEAIENANQFSRFKDYMHVDRTIQLDLEQILEKNHRREKGNLILLCGSVGDGKSHLLAYLKEKKPNIISDYTIFNDATESFSPNKNALETLEDILKDFSDDYIENSTEKIILAINMGVLHNFINAKHKKYSYNYLKKFVNNSNLFSQNITSKYSNETFDLLSFADYHFFELTEEGPVSSFYSTLLDRIFLDSKENPFYLALAKDEESNVHTMVHENYRFMQNKVIRNQVVQIIIQTIVKQKLVISARAFLNFIADILLPDTIQNINLVNVLDRLEDSLPNLLFNRSDRSPILEAVSQIDPIHRRSIVIDELTVELNTLSDWSKTLENLIPDSTSKAWLMPFNNESLADSSFHLYFETFIRTAFLTNQEFANNIQEISYKKFLESLYYFNVGNKVKIKQIYEEVKQAIFNWKGSPRKSYIYLNKPVEKFRLAQTLNLHPVIKESETEKKDCIDTFKPTIVLSYSGKNSDEIVLEIDYPLYQLLAKVREGYRPNKKDEEDAIKFVEFIEKLMNLGEKKKEMLIYFPTDNRFYVIKRDEFGDVVFERE